MAEGPAERVLLVSADKALHDAYAKSRDSSGWQLTFASTWDVHAKLPSVVLLDSRAGSEGTHEPFSRMREVPVGRLRALIETSLDEIPSLRMLAELGSIQDRDSIGGGSHELLVFYLIDEPSAAMTQTFLKMGADWVWSPRNQIDDIAAVISGLRSLRQDHTSDGLGKPRLLLVENSKEACGRVVSFLGDRADLVIVGEDRSGFDLVDITVKDALSTYEHAASETGIDGAIVDLALAAGEEEEAQRYFSSNDAGKKWFAEFAVKKDPRMLEVFSGVTVVRELRVRNPNLRIAVLSNWVDPAVVHNLIREILGPAEFSKIEIFAKADLGSGTLQEVADYLGVRDINV